MISSANVVISYYLFILRTKTAPFGITVCLSVVPVCIETFETGYVKPVIKFRVLQLPQSTFNIISAHINHIRSVFRDFLLFLIRSTPGKKKIILNSSRTSRTCVHNGYNNILLVGVTIYIMYNKTSLCLSFLPLRCRWEL